MSDRMMGQLEALTEINQQTAAKMEEINEAIGHNAAQIANSAREVDELRGLVGDLRRIVRDYKPVTWMTTTELAAHLHVHESTVRRLRKNGTIIGHRLTDRKNGRWMFDLHEVNEALRGRVIK